MDWPEHVNRAQWCGTGFAPASCCRGCRGEIGLSDRPPTAPYRSPKPINIIKMKRIQNKCELQYLNLRIREIPASKATSVVLPFENLPTNGQSWPLQWPSAPPRPCRCTSRPACHPRLYAHLLAWKRNTICHPIAQSISHSINQSNRFTAKHRKHVSYRFSIILDSSIYFKAVTARGSSMPSKPSKAS